MSIFVFLVFSYTDFKGIWVPRWSISDNNKIFSCLEGKFNHIFLQIFALGETYYPSKYAPSKMAQDKWLKDFLQEAHKKKIKVSAWVNVFYSWGYASRTLNPEHPINYRPDWYVQDLDGRSILDYSIEELETMAVEGYFIAPSNPWVRAYILKIIEEIINKYDFDGIHLDYVRYPNAQFTNNAQLRTKFMRKHYIDPMELRSSEELQSRLGLWGCEDLKSQWDNFIGEDLTMFIKNLNERLKYKRQDIYLSVAVKPDYLTARNEYYQDWLNWLNSNLVDFVCLMAYTKNIEGILNKTRKVIKEPHRVMIGLGLYCLSPAVIEKQVKLVDKTPFSGVVFFSYEELKKNQEYLKALDK